MTNKFDLSADKVVLDYEALRHVAIIALRRSLWDAEHAIDQIQSMRLDKTSCAGMESMGKALREASEDLDNALIAFGHLNDGMSRGEIIVIRDAKQSSLDKTLEKWDVPQV